MQYSNRSLLAKKLTAAISTISGLPMASIAIRFLLASHASFSAVILLLLYLLFSYGKWKYLDRLWYMALFSTHFIVFTTASGMSNFSLIREAGLKLPLLCESSHWIHETLLSLVYEIFVALVVALVYYFSLLPLICEIFFASICCFNLLLLLGRILLG